MRRSALASFCLFGTACVAASFTATAPFSRPSKPREQVDVLGPSGTTRPWRAVGTLHTRSGLGYRAGLNGLLGEAGQHGCDAVSDLHAGVAYDPSSVGGTAEKTREDDFSATCLIYTDWTPPVVVPAPRAALAPAADLPERRYPAGTPE